MTLTRSSSRIMPSTGDYRESKDALDKATTGIFRPIEGPAEFLRCEPVVVILGTLPVLMLV